MKRPVPEAFNPKVRDADIFWYGAGVSGLSAAAPTATALINIDADADFYCIGLSYQADVAAAALTESTNIIPLVTLQITDTSSGKALMNTPVPMGAFMGDGKRPYRFPRPRIFAANGTVQLNFVNFAAATTYNLRLTLHGYKVYN